MQGRSGRWVSSGGSRVRAGTDTTGKRGLWPKKEGGHREVRRENEQAGQRERSDVRQLFGNANHSGPGALYLRCKETLLIVIP